MYVKYGQ